MTDVHIVSQGNGTITEKVISVEEWSAYDAFYRASNLVTASKYGNKGIDLEVLLKRELDRFNDLVDCGWSKQDIVSFWKIV